MSAESNNKSGGSEFSERVREEAEQLAKLLLAAGMDAGHLRTSVRGESHSIEGSYEDIGRAMEDAVQGFLSDQEHTLGSAEVLTRAVDILMGWQVFKLTGATEARKPLKLLVRACTCFSPRMRSLLQKRNGLAAGMEVQAEYYRLALETVLNASRDFS